MKTINGFVLKRMIISGANNLYNHYPEIDALNVFPVPDGDTGTNMNLTISSGAKEVANRADNDVYEIAKAFSKGLLMGARGNSGVILSQIFRGFAVALEGKKNIKPTDLANAFIKGKEVAYKAVMRPVEGTILTVIREAATTLSEKVNDGMTIEKAFEILLKEGRASLKRTPELLPVLKEVGVVDSGGAGLLKILEGFNKAIHGEVIEKSLATVLEEKKVPLASEAEESVETGYCIEFVLHLGPEDSKKSFVERRFTNILSSHGELNTIHCHDDIVKVHIHTPAPGTILNYAQQFGEFEKIKVENLLEQHTHMEEIDEVEEAEAELKEYGLIAVSAGKGIDKMFTDELRVDYIVSGGQTMNPSTEDFIEAIHKVHAKNIFIMPNNSNIIMAASQACEVLEDEVQAQVIPSKSIPQGLVACMMFNPDVSPEENFEEMKRALKNVKTGQVTFAIKDTSIDEVVIKKDHYMGISDKKIICCHEDKKEAAYQLILSMIDDMTSIITILYGEDVTKEEAEEVVARIEEEHDDLDIDLREGDQPVYSFIIGVE